MNFSRVLATAVLVGAAACTFNTAPAVATGNETTTPDINTGVPQPTNPACNECLFQACGGQWAVCQQSNDCMAIYQCAIQPSCASDGQCVRGCYDAHPNGQRAYTALYTCDQAYACGGCNSQCGATAGSCQGVTPAFGTGNPPSGSDAGTGTTDSGTGTADAGTGTTDSGTTQPQPLDCAGCSNERCADEKAACGQGSECDAYSQCVTACADTACLTKCQTDHPTGATASGALATCTATKCATECGL